MSKTPNGADVGSASVLSVTGIGPTALAAPVRVTVIAPDSIGLRPGANCVEIVNAPGPVPEVGDTTSHGAFEDAVQVMIVPGPACVRWTAWAPVWALNAIPVVTALNVRELLSIAMVGGPRRNSGVETVCASTVTLRLAVPGAPPAV